MKHFIDLLCFVELEMINQTPKKLKNIPEDKNIHTKVTPLQGGNY